LGKNAIDGVEGFKGAEVQPIGDKGVVIKVSQMIFLQKPIQKYFNPWERIIIQLILRIQAFKQSVL